VSAGKLLSRSLDVAIAEDLEALRKAGRFRSLRRVSSRSGAFVECDGRTLLDFASNDYLGLATDPRISRAAAASASHDGVGAAAARLVSGNHALHGQLEEALARYKNTEAALLFSSGYAANIGAIPALVGRRDVIYADELNHASLIDACRLARAELRVISHVDTGELRRALEADAGRFRRRLIVVDAVFSMDGDLYPLDQLVHIAREHTAWTYVDDAHGTGVLGENGRGAAEHWCVEGEIDVLMGTLGKALGISGAFIAGSRVLIDFLINRARSFIYSTGTAPLLAAATLEALRIVSEEPWRRVKVRANARRLRAGLVDLGFAPAGEEENHIVPVLLGDSGRVMRAGARLHESGFLVGAIRPPTVPLGKARLRIIASAAHEADQIDALLSALGTTLAVA
jgi:8-amino-7-oxononanoate synthase